eukprot:1180752-Prorocentrum_minimum.AAC.1
MNTAAVPLGLARLQARNLCRTCSSLEKGALQKTFSPALSCTRQSSSSFHERMQWEFVRNLSTHASTSKSPN